MIFAIQVLATNSNQNQWLQFSSEWGLWILIGTVFTIGIVQAAFLFVVSRAIHRQANLQRFLTRQWVDVGNWSVGGGEPWEPGEIDRDRRTAIGKPRKLRQSLTVSVNFEVFNRSSIPLPIDAVSVDAGILKNGDWQWTSFENRSAPLLRPQSLECDNSEGFTITFDLADDEIVRYVQDGVFTRIHVKVFYTNSDGERMEQDFPIEAVLKPGTPAVFARQRSNKMREVNRQSSETKENVLTTK